TRNININNIRYNPPPNDLVSHGLSDPMKATGWAGTYAQWLDACVWGRNEGGEDEGAGSGTRGLTAAVKKCDDDDDNDNNEGGKLRWVTVELRWSTGNTTQMGNRITQVVNL